MSTQLSRGIETTVALFRSGATRATITTSAAEFEPSAETPAAVASERESVPTRRNVNAPVTGGRSASLRPSKACTRATLSPSRSEARYIRVRPLTRSKDRARPVIARGRRNQRFRIGGGALGGGGGGSDGGGWDRTGVCGSHS